METETTLVLDLDERNLAHFLSALALAALAGRVEGNDRESRRCWWPEPGHFAIRTEYPCDEFRTLLFARCPYLPQSDGMASRLGRRGAWRNRQR